MSLAKKPTALFISAHLPSPDIPAAGQKLAFRNLVKLSETHEVHLLAFVNTNERAHFNLANFKFCSSANFFEITRASRVARAVLNPHLPLKTGVRQSNHVMQIIRRLFKEHEVKKAHFEYTSSASYISMIPKYVPTVIVSHDVVFQSYQRFFREKRGVLRWIYWFEFVRQRFWERSVLKHFSQVVVLNEKDKAILAGEGIVNLEVQYPFVPEWISQVSRRQVIPNTVMFLGALNRPENEDAILFFLDSILPLIEREVPNCVLFIVGASPSREVAARASERVKVTGFVESLSWYFEHCHVAVAPLRFGAGIKIKVLETLAAGMPTICTDVGAEGVRADANLFVSNEPAEISRLVVSQLRLLVEPC